MPRSLLKPSNKSCFFVIMSLSVVVVIVADLAKISLGDVLIVYLSTFISRVAQSCRSCLRTL